jgi:hypothetical protein
MTKQLDLFMQTRDDDALIPPPVMEAFASNILCPNCMKENLVQIAEHDYSCQKCGQDFIKTDKSLRYK